MAAKTAEKFTPAPTGKISKNQRAGVKQVPRERLCGKGHPITTVRVVPVSGRRYIAYQCACQPVIDHPDVTATAGPAMTIKAPLVGKKSDGIRGGDTYSATTGLRL